MDGRSTDGYQNDRCPRALVNSVCAQAAGVADDTKPGGESDSGAEIELTAMGGYLLRYSLLVP
jgi:hypothetical protein